MKGKKSEDVSVCIQEPRKGEKSIRKREKKVQLRGIDKLKKVYRLLASKEETLKGEIQIEEKKE